MSRCDHCPRVGSPCRGEHLPRLCELVDPSHPDHAPAYVSALEPPADAEPEPPPVVPLRESLRVRRLGGRNCPHGGRPKCGCSGMAWCGLLKRDASLRDCLACLTTGPRKDAV